MDFENIDLDKLNSENIKLQKAKALFSTVGFAIAALALVRLVTQIFMMRVIYLFFPAIADLWVDWLLSVIPLYVFALPVFLLVLSRIPTSRHDGTYLVKGEDGVPAVADKPKFRIRDWAAFALTSMGVMYIGSYIGEYVMSVLSAVMGYDYSSALGDLVSSTPLWGTVIMTCILAPLGEEIIFRKLLIDKMRPYGDAVAILVSALAFGLFHMNFYQFFYAFFIGIILGYVYTLTGKLGWTVAIHAFVNFIGSIVIPRMVSGVDLDALAEGNTAVISQNPWPYVLYLAAMLIVFLLEILAVVAIILYCRRRPALSRGSEYLGQGRTAGAVLSNGGIVLALVTLGLLFAMNLLPVG